jgi:pantoate--beta-alanine ligase
MEIAETIDAIRRLVREAKADDQTVALVPTMGAMHEGHFSLIRRAREECGYLVVSIFVNPTQFAPNEDYEAYPRAPDEDLAVCELLGADAVFAPSAAEMYAEGARTEVTVRELSETLCGASRPTHFTGVCTVVAKLFHIVAPDRAYFGAKDFQQAVIIRRMVRDLNFPVEVVVCPTVRESDGLAASSRNAYLSAAQRRQAPALHEALQLAERLIGEGQAAAAEVIAAMKEQIARKAPDGEIDYIRIVDPESLRDVEEVKGPVLAALAVRLGPARLIDNLLISPRGGSSLDATGGSA